MLYYIARVEFLAQIQTSEKVKEVNPNPESRPVPKLTVGSGIIARVDMEAMCCAGRKTPNIHTHASRTTICLKKKLGIISK